MSIKTILTYSDGSAAAHRRIAAAAELARQRDAHLEVLAFGFEPELPPTLDGSAPMPVPPSTAEPDAEERARSAAEIIARAGVRGDTVPIACPFRRLPREVGDAARFCDLVVLDRPYGADVAETASMAFEGALFDGGAGVLVLPDGADGLRAETVLIAWNDSREALRAVRQAMPFLSEANSVEIAVFGSLPSEPMPGEALARMLSRHGIGSEIIVQVPAEDGIAASIRRRALESGAGLVVMGGYGHSRFSEWVLGGATRDYLAEFAVPVLMAH